MTSRNVKFLFVLPAVIWVLFFTIFPLVYSFGLSFFNIVLGASPKFVGLKNFIQAFDDYKVLNAARVTLVFIAVAIPIEMIVGMGLALFFNQEIPGRKYFRALLTMPLFFTPAALGLLGLTMFYEEGGPINNVLTSLLGIKIPWLSNSRWAMVAILLLEIWQWTPFVFLIFLAGLQGLPEEIYESALLDTSSGWQIFRWITLPLLQPVVIITLLLRLIEAVKIFDFAYTLTAGGPGTATEVYSLFIYRTGMKFFNFGYASSLSYLLLVTMMAVVTFFFNRMREIYE